MSSTPFLQEKEILHYQTQIKGRGATLNKKVTIWNGKRMLGCWAVNIAVVILKMPRYFPLLRLCVTTRYIGIKAWNISETCQTLGFVSLKEYIFTH